MQSRRKFISQGTLAAGALLTSNSVLAGFAAPDEIKKLTILHTNDVHSRLEPFPMDGSKNQGLGGVAQRASLINEIRNEAEHVLLLDAGDIFQGTPFFNIYKGEPEIKAMTAMNYDAATIGNHDFDAGLDDLALQLQHANFPILICNYDFSNTPMNNKYQEYKTFKRGKLKIGVTGVGIELQGLVAENLFGNTKYLDPVENANRVALKLKNEEKCDMIICLSHLGFRYQGNKVSDEVLAAQSENIDLIIGGHTHTFFDNPLVYKNKIGNDVIVNQVGWAGIVLGRLDFEFSKFKNKNLAKAHTVVIGKKTRE
ncbi:MAG: 5-nucleotidase [Chitinophagaceae bacterium]|nr:5-nucleotidase [Chitinophagaceae bacterium]